LYLDAILYVVSRGLMLSAGACANTCIGSSNVNTVSIDVLSRFMTFS
jgi:hypothetical protein